MEGFPKELLEECPISDFRPRELLENRSNEFLEELRMALRGEYPKVLEECPKELSGEEALGGFPMELLAECPKDVLKECLKECPKVFPIEFLEGYL